VDAKKAQPVSPLVSTEELARHPEWRVFDCRHDLGKPDWGAQEYAKAHIPGALFAHLDRDLSAPKSGRNGRHPLPDPATFAKWLGNQGLNPTDQVVCYDLASGAFASRLWWMLRWVGHDAVAVLDGGLAKWVKENRPTTAEIPHFPATSYSAHPRAAMAVDVGYIESHLGKDLLLDARSAQRYRGEVEPIDPVAGHIPGALNRNNSDNLSAAGTFKQPDELKQEFAAVLGGRAPSEVVNYCGSGVAACHNALAMEVAGLTGSRLYAGSWSEWIADPRRPQEKG
jgi:thiosulfate/3-mercaptopyruvate sulfurtransferase